MAAFFFYFQCPRPVHDDLAICRRFHVVTAHHCGKPEQGHFLLVTTNNVFVLILIGPSRAWP